MSILGRGLAFTAYGQARVVRESLRSSPGVVAAGAAPWNGWQDHLADGRTEMLDGARWSWRDDRAAADYPALLDELEGL